MAEENTTTESVVVPVTTESEVKSEVTNVVSEVKVEEVKVLDDVKTDISSIKSVDEKTQSEFDKLKTIKTTIVKEEEKIILEIKNKFNLITFLKNIFKKKSI